MNISTEVDAFHCFFDVAMLDAIVENTNKYARYYLRAKGKDAEEWQPLDIEELKGVLGVLHLLGVYRSQHKSLRSLWSTGHSGRPIFSAAFK